MSEGERRLAVIMFTDIVGFTALAQKNESQALAVLEQHRRIMRPVFTSFGGREIKTVGDAFLVEFGSARDAVLCAVEVQKRLHEWRSEYPDSGSVAVRVGIHLGDVVHSAGDIYGDAVNIASRLEGLAEPGGVCISEQVYESVRNKTDLELAEVGEKELKNVERPVKVYRIVMEWNSPKRSAPYAPRERVAVLPFVSMSPDPNDEYFADGLTEELIGKVSQIKGLEVIARTSVMAFKKKEKKVSDIARELNVGTVIEGSVRKAGNRIRVTVQVIDAGTEGHLFSSNYDSTLDDIFAVQSDVAAKVAESVPGTILSPKAGRAAEKETGDALAYSYFLKGTQLSDRLEEEPLRQGLRLLEQAVQLDPSFARAYAGITKCYIELGNGGYIEWQEAISKGRAAVTKALELDPDLALAHSRLAEIMFMADDNLDLRRAEVRRAIELNSNLAEAYSMLANDSGTDGDIDGMVRAYEKAYQLDPLSPNLIRGLGRSYMYAGRTEEALAHWRKTAQLEPYGTYRFMFDHYASNGDLEHAKEMVTDMEKIAPTLEYTILNRGLLAALTGDAATAHAMIAKLDSTHAPGWARSSSAGFIYLELGDLDKFFEYMFRAVQDHTLQVTNLRFNPLLANARKDPRFAEIFARAGLPYKPEA